MTVLDASAAVPVLADEPEGRPVLAALEDELFVSVPDHFHAEALSGVRGLAIGGKLARTDATAAIERLRQLRVMSFPALELVRDIWALRHELTVYDAAYLALARSLDTQLITLDAGLAAVAKREGRLAATR
ncbi:MAG: type II toxin-antitoxin system VapC family toxin [Solirubrobacteraceae bacterium]